MVATTLREDGVVRELAPNEVLQARLDRQPEAIVVVDLGSFIPGASLRAITLEGIAPRDSRFPLAHPVYLYLKLAHRGLVRALDELVAEAASERALGAHGYLAELGLVPFPAPALPLRRGGVAAHPARISARH